MIITNHDISRRAFDLAPGVKKSLGVGPGKYKCAALYGVPRGGVAPCYALGGELMRIGVSVVFMDDPEDANVIVDDIVNSGATKKRFMKINPNAIFVSFYKADGGWKIFPWEGTLEQSAEDIPVRLLQFIGEDITRGGLKETPKRFLKAWQDHTSGYGKDPKAVLKVFKDGAERCDEMVLQKNIPVYSHCEHHLAPFFGVAHVAYIPKDKIVGLSKISRLVDIFAKRLQVQERLTNQIADALHQCLAPLGAGVVLECRHLCMESRGIRQQGTSTTTSALRGVLKDLPEAREEFMGLIK